MHNTGYRSQDAEHRIQNTGYRTHNTEYRIQDIEHKIQNTG